jgi:hypothetical protein
MAGTKNSQIGTQQSSTRVTSRNVVSAPTKTIQVEQVRVSEKQSSSVTSAIRAGRQAASKE